MAGVTYTIKLVDLVTRTASRISRSLDRIRTSAEKAGSAIDSIGVMMGGLAIGAVFKFGAELEKTQVQFNTLTGSVEKGTKLFNELTEFANMTPFSNAGLNKNASMLLAFGLETEKVIKTMRMLGDVSSGDQERLNGLTLAFGQIMARGKLMGGELNQLIERGFNPLKRRAKRTGEEYTDLQKKMSKGLITFEDVRKEFEIATKKGGDYHKMTERMANTMAGKWSTVLGKGQYALGRLGLELKDVFVPILDKTIGYIDKFVVWIEKNKDAIKEWGGRIARFIPIFLGLVGAFKLLSIAMSTNPIGAIITGIAILAVYADDLAQKMGGWSNVFDLMGDATDLMKQRFSLFVDSMSADIDAVTRKWELFQKLISMEISFPNYLKQMAESRILEDKTAIDIAKKQEAVFKKMQAIADKRDKLLSGEYKIDPTKVDKAKADASSALSDAIGLSPDASKIAKEGIVSGGIKTFNININTLNGIQTYKSTSVGENKDAVAEAVQNALLEGISDVKMD